MNSFTSYFKSSFLTASLCLCSVLASQAAQTPEGKTLEASTPPISIAQGGKALVPIVISPDSSEATRKTAAELAGYLKRMTGAEFTIEESKTPKGITVGTLAQFPDPTLNEPMAIKDTYNGVEAFAIKSDGGRIRLLGNTDLGVSHAVYRFLELQGCRWFFMGKNWEVIPETSALSFDLNEVDRPLIWCRDIWMGGLNRPAEPGDENRVEVFKQWAKTNRMAESMETNVAHNWQAIPNAFKDEGSPFKKEFEAHPEYFALVDGKRTPPQFCVSNPGLQKIILQYVNRYFEKNPKADMVSLDTADQPGWCTCAECAKIGPYTAQPFYLGNIAAKELQKTHPGKYVGVLAYSWHSDPPEFVLEPNFYIMLTVGMNASKFSFDELFDMWSKKCKSIGIYEYYSYWEMDKSLLPGTGPQNKLDDSSARIKRYIDNNVVSMSPQASPNWGVNGLGYYIANRMMWNPASSTPALKKDFYTKAFGPAAVPMERYFERLNLSNKPFPGVSMLRQSITDLDEATVLAKNRPDVLARLDDLKANMIYNYLGQKVEDAPNDEEQKKYALEWFTWAYRARNTHMFDWLTFRGSVGNSDYKPTMAAKFNEPSWNFRKTKENPWRVNEPITSQELTKKLEEIKKEWGEVPAYTAKKFSNDLVLVQAGEPGNAQKKREYSGSADLLMVSLKGEPLKFNLNSFPSPNIVRKDAAYSLKTLDGKQITEGKLEDGENAVELKVPGPGIYQFFARRTGRGWGIELPDTMVSGILVKRETDLRPVQSVTGYFYVPKGSTQITMHVQWGTVTVKDPDGKVAYEGKSEGKLTAIPVKPGMDGKVWSILGKNRYIWFLDVPTVLSDSPDKIFVPKEVASKDALQIVAK